MKLGSMMLVMLLAAGAPLGAQSLAEIAQKEKEKRAAKAMEASAQTAKPGAKAPETKVYTVEDLAAYAEKPAAPPASEDTGEGAPPPAAEPSTEAGAPRVRQSSEEQGSRGSDDSAARDRQEQSWRSRAQSARAAVEAAESELAAAQKAKAGLGIGPQLGRNDDPLLRAGFNRQVAEAEQRVARAQSGVAAAKTSLNNLEDEARRSGASPGWLR